MSTTFYHPGPEQPTPEQRLLLFDAEMWESFIEQCARQLQAEGKYIHVHRLGGAGDKGRDVCGYLQELPKESTWDLYQGKYYGGTLSPSAFAPDILLNNVLGSYKPRENIFMYIDLVVRVIKAEMFAVIYKNYPKNLLGTYIRANTTEERFLQAHSLLILQNSYGIFSLRSTLVPPITLYVHSK